MTKEEAIKELRGFIGQLTEGCQEAIKVLIPELRESEDERIRKFLVELVSNDKENNYRGLYEDWKIDFDNVLAWLEKQKEQPQEELVYRLNGLMIEYVKEGKDDAEKEHRFKCYRLFWDASEDADFFEQKERNMDEWLEDGKRCYEKGKADALKELPKWKKVETNAFYPDITYSDKGKCPMLHYGEYKINIVKLKEALPKEEE